MPGTPTQGLQVKKKVIKSPTSFYEDPFNNTAHYHVLKRHNFSWSHLILVTKNWFYWFFHNVHVSNFMKSVIQPKDVVLP